MAIAVTIRVVELQKHKVYQMAFVELACVPRESCFLQLQFVVEVEEKTTFFTFFYLLDNAKANFSVIILNSGFRIPDSGFRFPDSGFQIPAFRVARRELQTVLPTFLS